MPIPRKSLVSIDTTSCYHVVSRCVRRTFLFGVVDSKDFSHRRDAIVARLAKLTKLFCIDISAYAIMSNHYHLVVRIQKQRALDLSLSDVHRRWSDLYSLPVLAKRYIDSEMLSDPEQSEAIRQIEERRARLYDLSWFMRCLNEPIARAANQEDGCTGRFWEGRFKSQALLDERAELQAMAYVDLNPIRAQSATSLKNSDFTSIQTRLNKADSPMKKLLRPFATAPHQKQNPAYIPYSFFDYLQLIDWSSRQMKSVKPSSIAQETPPALAQLQIRPDIWLLNCERLEHIYRRMIGSAAQMSKVCEKLKLRHIVGIVAARDAFG